MHEGCLILIPVGLIHATEPATNRSCRHGPDGDPLYRDVDVVSTFVSEHQKAGSTARA